jgi:hypothetical protein
MERSMRNSSIPIGIGTENEGTYGTSSINWLNCILESQCFSVLLAGASFSMGSTITMGHLE